MPEDIQHIFHCPASQLAVNWMRRKIDGIAPELAKENHFSIFTLYFSIVDSNRKFSVIWLVANQSFRSCLPILYRMPWILVTVQQRHSYKTEHRSSQLELAATEGQASRDPRNDQHHHQPSRLSQCNELPEQCKQ